MNFTDPVEDAVLQWNDGQESLFNFAVSCSEVVGLRNGETARLARRIQRDPATVELYAKGGKLWTAMLEKYPAEAELLRDVLQISFWNAIGAKWDAKLFDLVDAKNWLETARDQNLTVDKLRTMLPNVKGGASPFTRATKRIYDIINKDILNAPSLNSEMQDGEYRVFLKVMKWTVKFLEARL